MKGVYEVSPGLKTLGTDFGNGLLDQKLFQFDTEWRTYLVSKAECVSSRPSFHLLRSQLPEEVEARVISFLTDKLLTEWPEYFEQREGSLFCRLTEKLIPIELDSLVSQVQEDLAIVVVTEEQDHLAYLNVCSPSHWAPESKIGQSFFETHLPVPGFERINSVAAAMARSMVNKGPFVRFVWTLESDLRLNHHPIAPEGSDSNEWRGRDFSKGFYVRVERQSTWGLPEVGAALFAIRVSFVDGLEVLNNPKEWQALESSIRSMSPESKAYKGLETFLDTVRNPSS